MTRRTREISAGGIVVRRRGAKAEVLLIKDLYGRWTWPKGKLEPRETAREAALREVEEETGLRGLRILGEAGRIGYEYRRDGLRIDKTVRFFLMEAVAGSRLSIQTSEVRDGRWFTRETALKKVGYAGAKGFLKKSMRIYEKGIVR